MMTDKWKAVSATWKGDFKFSGEVAGGGSIQMDSTKNSPAIGPMQLILIGLAGCTGIDVVSILQKKKVLLSDFKVNVRGKRAPSPPMVYSEIEVEYLLWSDNLKKKDIEQAIQLSEDKYCSVSVMLAKTARITSSYKILRPDQAEPPG